MSAIFGGWLCAATLPLASPHLRFSLSMAPRAGPSGLLQEALLQSVDLMHNMIAVALHAAHALGACSLGRRSGPPMAVGVLRAMEQLLTPLRIDVALPDEELERELNALYQRWLAAESPSDELTDLALPGDGLVFKTRQADGEHFVYAIDPARQKLAAYVVMSRLIEVDRRADKYLRSPHAKVSASYRRLGITSRIYRWWLGSGRSLMTGARQSAAAHALWQSLAKDHELVHVSVEGKRVRALPSPVSEATLDDLGTRMVLLAKGCQLDQFAMR